jgi:hypothetical protein
MLNFFLFGCSQCRFLACSHFHAARVASVRMRVKLQAARVSGKGWSTRASSRYIACRILPTVLLQPKTCSMHLRTH